LQKKKNGSIIILTDMDKKQLIKDYFFLKDIFLSTITKVDSVPILSSIESVLEIIFITSMIKEIILKINIEM